MSRYTRVRYKAVDCFYHVIMRGGRGMNIVEDDDNGEEGGEVDQEHEDQSGGSEE